MPRFICSLPDLKHAASMNHVFWRGRRGHRHNGQWEGGWRAEPSSSDLTRLVLRGPTLRVFCQHQLGDIYRVLPHVPGATIGRDSRRRTHCAVAIDETLWRVMCSAWRSGRCREDGAKRCREGDGGGSCWLRL